MKNKYKIIFLVLCSMCLSNTIIYAKNTHFNEGKKLFINNKYKKSKILFQKDIVFNPKNEMSYLYLAKIFKKENNDTSEENNLNTVLLLDPKNEEAVYLLTLLNIKKSNFSKAKELIDKLNLVCKNFCSSKKELEIKLNSSLKSK